jgi:hypothetical protein
MNLMDKKYYIVEQVLAAKLLQFISTNFGIYASMYWEFK